MALCSGRTKWIRGTSSSAQATQAFLRTPLDLPSWAHTLLVAWMGTLSMIPYPCLRNGTRRTPESPALQTSGRIGSFAREQQGPRLVYYWFIFNESCSGWKTRPAEQFKGSVGARTSFPAMFIGNTADPVTPLVNAKTMSKLFPRSSVLTVNSPGVSAYPFFRTFGLIHFPTAHFSRYDELL